MTISEPFTAKPTDRSECLRDPITVKVMEMQPGQAINVSGLDRSEVYRVRKNVLHSNHKSGRKYITRYNGDGVLAIYRIT